MQDILGTTFGVFVFITFFVMGFAAYMTGQALANTWKPLWQLLVYCALLGLADRFLTFALFEGELLSLTGYIIDTFVLTGMAVFAFRLNRTNKMVSQYPWLYERSSLFTWRDRI
ncbi:MAG: hypothetical protein V3R66_08075 [Rhodospirillales bacterium]